MLVDFIYSNPTWLWGSILVVLSVLASCFGLVVFNRLVPDEKRRASNDAAQGMVAVVGTCFAVLIAFIAVATWQAFADGDKAAGEEANYLANIYQDTLGLPEDKAAEIRADVKKYLKTVVQEEWPAQQRGQRSHAARSVLEEIHGDIIDIGAKNQSEAVIEIELLRTINSAYSARRARQLAADSGVPAVVWTIIAIGTVLTNVYAYLFGVSNFHLHLAMTAGMAASLSMVIVLIIALDRPFRGDLSISTEAYDQVLEVIAEIEAGKKQNTIDAPQTNGNGR